MKYTGRVNEHGELHIIHRKNFALDLKQEFARPGKEIPVVIEVKRKRSERTLSQNAYWWGVVIMEIRDRLREMSGERWISKEHAHEFILLKVHYIELVDEGTGLVERIRKDTRDLTKSDYAELIDKTIEWCEMFLDIRIPPPDTQAAMEFEEEYREGPTDDNAD